MSAHRDDITAAQRVHLAATMVANPEENRTELARKASLSRTSLYRLYWKGREALQRRFSPRPPPAGPSDEGFWIFVDANAIKRAAVTLRAVCGATISAIVVVLVEVFCVRLSERTVLSAVHEGYERAFVYQSAIRLEQVKRVAFDEMYRWQRCVFTGIDCESLVIFLAEKQPGPTKKNWEDTMKRLKKEQGLVPEQVCVDGHGSLDKAAEATWEDARIVHDIGHIRFSLERVRSQFDQRAYTVMEKTEAMRKRWEKGPTRRTSQQKLDQLLAEARAKEDEAVELADHVEKLVKEAHKALNIVNRDTGHVNTVSFSQQKLKELAPSFQSLKTTYAGWVESYLKGLAQDIVAERAEFVRQMIRLAAEQEVRFEAVEKAVFLWELAKQHKAATWPGTREALEKGMSWLWAELESELKTRAQTLLPALFIAFSHVLAASSLIEWGNERLSAVVKPHKRLSGGFLNLRAAYLNLSKFIEGKRKGRSPHELLTGQRIHDWLVKLGYGPKNHKEKTFKSLGWRRLVAPFVASWRNNWLGNARLEASEAIAEASEAA